MVNISKTLAYNSQVQTMFHWKLGSALTEKMTVPNVFPVMVGSLDLLFVESMKDFGYELDTCSTVHVSHSVSVFGHFSNWLCSCFKL